MLYLLLEDPRGIERLAQIQGQISDPSLRESNTTSLDGQKATPADLRNACLAFPFLAPKRLVVVRGLVARFQPKERAGASRAAAPKGIERAKGLEQEFAEALRQVPDHTDLVLMETKPPRVQGPLHRALSELKAEIQRPLGREDLPVWIRQRVTAKGGRIDATVSSQLAAMVDEDLLSLDQELEKLVTFADGQPISWKDVQSVVSIAKESNIFALVDRLAEGNAKGALQELHRLLGDGVAVPQIMAMVGRQFRLLLLWKELVAAGVPDREVTRQLRLADFVAEKVSRQAARYTLKQLEEVYRRLLDIDLRWKTGRGEPVPALEILISELALARRRTPGLRTSG